MNIKSEMKRLEANFYNNLKIYSKSDKIHRKDKTFREDNWIMNFPFNYHFFGGNSSIDVIRKLSLVNALYGTFFLREDNVLDEYHTPKSVYQDYILKMCEAHTLRNLAIGQLLHLCGDKIYEYIFEYEKMYYHAIIHEKSLNNVSLENMLQNENLVFLGHKAILLIITFCAFCLLRDIIDKIPICENLILNYHIAHQLNDDLMDLKNDMEKPDQSYVIKAFKTSSNLDNISLNDIKELLFEKNYDYKIIEQIGSYLNIAEPFAQKLNFQLFLKQINRLKRKVDNYRRNA